MIVFAVHQYELAIGIHVCPPFGIPLFSLSPQLLQSAGFDCPVSYIKLPLAICFTYVNVYVSMLFSQVIPSFPSPTESKSLFFLYKYYLTFET